MTWDAVPRDGFQPAIVPPSVTKMTTAPALLGPTRKLVAAPLNTIPVGAPSTLTLRFRLTPVALYSVEKSAPLSETHQGVPGPATRPQAFTRRASTVVPGTPLFETSAVTVYLPETAAADAGMVNHINTANVNTRSPVPRKGVKPENSLIRTASRFPWRP